LKTKHHSALCILHSAFILGSLTLFTSSLRAPGQTVWSKALSFDGVNDHVLGGAVNVSNIFDATTNHLDGKLVNGPLWTNSTVPPFAINADVTHQTIEGFGGAIAFFNNWLAAHPYEQEIYTNIFSGLNLGILRLGNWFRYQGVADFDPATREIVSNANRILGRPLTIQMSSWAPPAFLKSNGTTGNGGTLIKTNGVFAYTNFANYWYDALMWYKTNGIVPSYISIQNEPDFAAGWDSCVFHPTEDTVEGTHYASYAKALEATYQRLTNLPAPPKILGPEVVGLLYNRVQNYAATMNPSQLYGIHDALGSELDAGDLCRAQPLQPVRRHQWPAHLSVRQLLPLVRLLRRLKH